MKVSELKKLLDQFPDNAEIVVASQTMLTVAANAREILPNQQTELIPLAFVNSALVLQAQPSAPPASREFAISK